MDDRSIKNKNTAIVISASIVAFVLVGYVVLGLFVRPEEDDFYFALWVHWVGFFETIYNNYQNWLGRFSQVALTGVFSYLGPYGSQLSPALLLFGLVAGIWYALRPFTRQALCLALVGVYTFLAALPNLWQTLYWQSAAHTYIAPFVVAVFIFGLLFRHQHPILIALLSFFACGFNEGFSPLLLASLIAAWFVRRDLRPMTSAAIIGVLLGTLALFTAPGNFNRAAFNKVLHPPLLKACYLALKEGVRFLLSCGIKTIVPLLLTGAMAGCAFPDIKLSRNKRILLIIIVTLAAISFSGLNLIPAQWAHSLHDRVYTANVVILILFTAAIFVISGIRLPNRIIIILTLITAIPTLYILINTTSRLIPYAREFDKGNLTDTYAELAKLKPGRQPLCFKTWKKIWLPESSLQDQ